MPSIVPVAALVVAACVAGCTPDPTPRDTATRAAAPVSAGLDQATNESQPETSSNPLPETVPAVAFTPDMPIPGKPGSVGLCPRPEYYVYMPNTGMCTLRKRGKAN